MDEDMDWDYYEYGQKEQQNAQTMKGIAQFNICTVYQHPKFTEKNFTYFNITQNINNLVESYGTWAKDSEIIQSFSAVIEFKKDANKIKEDFTKIEVPSKGQGTIYNPKKDSRLKFGGIQDAYPKTAIGLLVTTFKNGKKIRGSAFMVGPNHALTSAHMVFNKEEKSQENNQITSIQFYPSYHDDITILPNVEIAKALILDEYHGNSSDQFDIALLITTEPIGYKTGWLGMAKLPKETLSNSKIMISGYSQFTDKTMALLQSQGKLDNVQPEIYEYTADTSAGMNGGPIIAEHAISQTQVALYVLGVHTGSHNNKNYGQRLSQAKFQKIKEMIQFHFLPQSLEEIFFQYLERNLCKVELAFDHTQTTSKMFADCLYSLKQNPEFKSITFKSRSSDNQHLFTQECMQELADSLKVMRKLEELRIDLYNINNIQINSLQILVEGFSNLKELKQFTLSLNNNLSLTNQSLKDLSAGFSFLGKVNSISILLQNLQNISDEGLKFLGAGFSKMNQLKTLKIELQILKKCSEKGIREMCKCLVSCKWLQKLSIETVGFQFTETTQKVITDDFKWIPSFKLT